MFIRLYDSSSIICRKTFQQKISLNIKMQITAPESKSFLNADDLMVNG